MINPTTHQYILDLACTLPTDQLDQVTLADLRDALGRLPRGEVDRVLRDLAMNREIDLAPEVNPKTLTDRERNAAIHMGGEDHHYLYLTIPR